MCDLLHVEMIRFCIPARKWHEFQRHLHPKTYYNIVNKVIPNYSFIKFCCNCYLPLGRDCQEQERRRKAEVAAHSALNGPRVRAYEYAGPDFEVGRSLGGTMAVEEKRLTSFTHLPLPPSLSSVSLPHLFLLPQIFIVRILPYQCCISVRQYIIKISCRCLPLFGWVTICTSYILFQPPQICSVCAHAVVTMIVHTLLVQ